MMCEQYNHVSLIDYSSLLRNLNSSNLMSNILSFKLQVHLQIQFLPSNTTGVPLKQILMESTGELVDTSVEALRQTSLMKVY